MTSPFEPPGTERTSASYSVLLVVGTWGLAGAAVGTAIGTTLQLTRALAGGGAIVGISGMAIGGVLGALALQAERHRAAGQPALVDERGQSTRPLHGALFVVPILALVPALSWLVVVGSVGLNSVVPAIAFGVLAVAVLWASRRVVSRHRLARVLQALEAGSVHEGTSGLEALAAARWPTASVRATARLNRAMLALAEGDLETAQHWFAGLHGIAAGWAHVGLGLIMLLRGGPEAASEHLTAALTGPASRGVQAQADAVRVLLVWRTAGEAEAHRIAEQLLSPDATGLHRALLAALRLQGGDAAGGEALCTPEVLAFVQTGLGQTVPELRSLPR